MVMFAIVFGIAGLVALSVFWKHKMGLFLFLGLVGYGLLVGSASGAVTGNLLRHIFSS